MQKDFIDKLAFIDVQNKKILVTLSKGKDKWYIPGGKREKNETDREALIREVREELSLDLDPATTKYYGTFSAQAHGKPLGVIVRMTCYTAFYKGEIKVNNEIEKYDFFSYSQKELTSTVDHLIFDDLKQKGFLE